MDRISYSDEFVCPKCGRHTALVFHTDGTNQAHCMICDVYYDVEIAPVTNYDRLVSKSPEELAEWIMSIEPAACPFRDDHGDDCRFTHCEKCWLDWLKEVVDE